MAFIAADTITVASENTTVDLLVWRKFRRPMPGYVEELYRANPNLAESDIFLAPGTVIKFHAIDTDTITRTPDYVRLWE